MREPADLVQSIAQAEEPLLLEDEKNTSEIFRRVSPSVVFITTAVRETDMFSFNSMEVPRGSGSGFIWDSKGHVVTNFHVVNGASSWSVTLPGKQEDSTYQAQVVGVDPSRDIAVLRIDAPASRLKPVQLGASDVLQVGQKVLAIGNPFGLDQTLTTGIVSALGREIDAENGRKIHEMIQTDASINPGNSGGPLLDSRGRVIGINTAIYSPTGTSAGIGFAVPVNQVKRVVPQILQYGKPLRIGIGVLPVTDSVARANGIRGVIIARVVPGAAADRAGLRGLVRGRRGEIVLGDVIVGLAGKAIEGQEDLYSALDAYKSGDEVDVVVIREGKRRSARVTLQIVD
jgi:S1-C subfamily serine protease